MVKTASKRSKSAVDLQIAELKSLVAQREREFSELNHRIANSLQIAAAFLTLQQQRLGAGAAKDALKTTSARLAGISKLHRHLYTHGASARTNLKTFLQLICPDIAASTGLVCAVDVEPIEMPAETAQQLAIAINEFAINAGKHAYHDDGGALKIHGRRDGDGRLRLSVADGGPGLGDGFDLTHPKGLGLTIVSAIARQLGAELIATNDQGARFTLLVPVSQNDRSDAHIQLPAPRRNRPRRSPALGGREPSAGRESI
jgi:two-component system, sensor histidine kinase PdtaS